MLNFEDTKTAFATKSDTQLKKAYWLFKLVASQKLVSFGKWSSALAMKIGLPIKGMVKSTVYDQFVGGETIDECKKTIDELKAHGVYSILDYSVEGAKTENDFDQTAAKTIETIDYGAQNGGVPFAVFKVTGIARFGLLHKISDKKLLSDTENAEFLKVRKRIKDICQKGATHNIAVLIDAEESWIQPAIDDLALEMMREFNREKCMVFNTLQMYRWDRLDYLKEVKAIAEKEGFLCGVKLVRGAYMEKERERAYDLGYKSPIQPDKEATDRDYDLAIEFCLANHKSICLVAGSHNEASTRELTELMEKHGVPKSSPHIWFSQLYGMSDNLSFNLAKEGYNVVKYLPFGPIEKTLPYLIRRAEENTSAAGQTSRELKLIEKELKRRGID
jgi:proline dehydrogenase